MTDWTYTFDDGSGFAMHSVAIWNSSVLRALSEGTGRFAGMKGSTTGVGKAPSAGPITVLWTGTYEVIP